MIKITAKGFELSHSHEEILRTMLGYRSISEYEDEVELALSIEGDNCHAVWREGDIVFENALPTEPLGDIKSMKLCIYRLLCKVFDKTLPWGSLTGIRPVAYLEENIKRLGEEEAKRYFIELYGVKPDKYETARKILELQKNILSLRENNFLVYVHIPFCPTRCKYCSFSVIPLDKFKKAATRIDDYVDVLCKEIREGSDIITAQKPCSIYIGGGTPSTLNSSQIRRLFDCLNNSFKGAKEITFEAGRPDTITEELLEALSECRVTRMSINPQTMNQSTLDRIGRVHRVEDIYRAFELADRYDISINTDIILGLTGETSADVEHTIDELIKLKPDNITVHSLAIKNGSYYQSEKERLEINMMTDREAGYIAEKLNAEGYNPYYLYRQRRQVGEAENIGYAKPGTENIFNILTMDDKVNVLGFGMGAVSKFIEPNGTVNRVFGSRDLDLYFERYHALNLEKKSVYQSIDSY